MFSVQLISFYGNKSGLRSFCATSFMVLIIDCTGNKSSTLKVGFNHTTVATCMPKKYKSGRSFAVSRI